MNSKMVFMSICGTILLVQALLTSNPQAPGLTDQLSRHTIAGEFVIKLEQGVTFKQIRGQKGLNTARIRQRFTMLSKITGHQYLLIKVADIGIEQQLQTPHVLTKIPGVAAACPNTVHHLARLPNDPLFHQQWGLHNAGQAVFADQGKVDADIDAPAAWDISIGSTGVVVAVLDTGIDITHEDLKTNIWENSNSV